MTAQPVKPARYRPGKAAYEVSDSDSSDEGEEREKKKETKKPAPKPSATSFRRKAYQIVEIQKSKVEEREAVERAARLARAAEAESESAEEEAEEEEEESGGDEQESEVESDSSEERRHAQLKSYKPTFIKKAQRGKIAEKTEDEIWEEQEERRKQLAQEALEEQVDRVKEEKKAGKKEWDDDALNEDDIDDTDDVDPQREYMEWKLRELKRLKRDRDRIVAREKEIEEIERRRNLTEEERMREDEEWLEKQREERGEKGEVKYMQKYFHKGAFFADDLKAAGLAERAVMGGKFEDEVDKSNLPKFMQIRDMNKLGKKGRTRYTDMRAEDTGQWGGLGDRRGPREDRDLDERFREDFDRDSGPSGANKVALGERKRPGDDLQKEPKKSRFNL
jgi:microfibrillar-associated protein 1